CEQRITKVSLVEILRCFEHPLSEEQAWAVCFQCCCKMKQLAQGPCPPLHSVFINGPESIFIHADGTASFMVYHESDVSSIQQSEDKLLEYLGMMIYEALDWGISDQVERELSDPLEKLLCLMLKLDDGAMKPAVTLQDVIKACEEHLSRSSEATNHYQITCRRLFTGYMELKKLITVIQTSKEVHLRSPLSCLFPLHSHTHLAVTGFSEASLWPSVVRELQNGVKLRKATERPQHHLPPAERIRSPYELLLDDIQCKRFTLRKVNLSLPNPMNSSVTTLLLAFSGPMFCFQVLERKLKEHVPQESSWQEQLMVEVKHPQKLQSPAARKNGSRPKGTCY
ncbi:SPIR1 protein, partial [Probosciger aterrimus]|nr:SPIR1 protein [Probosciger aterrimus]